MAPAPIVVGTPAIRRPSRGRRPLLPLASIFSILSIFSVFSIAGLVACSHKTETATSPEDAFDQLVDAANTGDTARLFDALDTRTQWAIETVHKSQREMRGLIVESYPPAERDAAMQRLPAACEEDLTRPRRYYRRLSGVDEILADLKRRLYLGTGQPVGSVRKAEGIAEVWREGGSIFHFARDEKGRWGFMELREFWERGQERALHELDTVKSNAALYKKVAPAPKVPAAAPSPGDQKGSG